MQAKTEVAARGLVFVCRPGHGSLVVVSLWEDDDVAARVPKRFGVVAF